LSFTPFLSFSAFFCIIHDENQAKSRALLLKENPFWKKKWYKKVCAGLKDKTVKLD